ncbi:5305_t:CDS:2 [Gigaspora margarita]|uniref:5305_t:CDS:1 n=1 Tax=Gigaspora margarita TaxID=4874 RepID=A0ABN7URQ1_GIGMA|nr:5305_t:CDS:2 [Gigaspora margarita]
MQTQRDESKELSEVNLLKLENARLMTGIAELEHIVKEKSQDNSSKQIGLQCNETPIYNIVDNASISDELNDIPGSDISDNIFLETKPYENKEIKFMEQVHKEHINCVSSEQNTDTQEIKESEIDIQPLIQELFLETSKKDCIKILNIEDSIVHNQKSYSRDRIHLKSKNVGFNPISDYQNHTTKLSSSKDVSDIEVNIPTETSQAFNSKDKVSISLDSSPENDQDLKLPEVEINTSTEVTGDEVNNKESSDEDNSDDEGQER